MNKFSIDRADGREFFKSGREVCEQYSFYPKVLGYFTHFVLEVLHNTADLHDRALSVAINTNDLPH